MEGDKGGRSPHMRHGSIRMVLFILMRYTLWILRMRFTTHTMRFTTHGSLYSSTLYTDALYVMEPLLSQCTSTPRDIPFPVQQQQLHYTSAQYAVSKQMNQGFAIMSRLLPIADGS